MNSYGSFHSLKRIHKRIKKHVPEEAELGNYAKFLKNLHTEQLAKLQLKNQHECDLLEDIRQFTIKRSAIEKSYSEALLKISAAYLNKKIPNIPDIKIDGSDEKWNMWSVWRTVLEENEKLAKARLAAIEVFQQQIADESKLLRDYKVAVSKKCINQLGNIQKELQICVQDVDKTKKQYFDEEHSAHDVRDKARDIEEKLKKKKGSFFQSITSLQKNSARVTSRKEQLEEKSTGARNDYLLSLAAANAHQTRYFTVDLQTTMNTMENYVYERVAEYLTLMGRTELLTCHATQNSFGKIRDQAQQLTREYNLQCCYLFYPVLKQHIHYDMDKCDNDTVLKITAEHESAAATLSSEAKLVASRIVRHNNMIREYARKLATCSAMREAGQRIDPNDQNGPDLETKMEDFRENIRKAETAKVKAEARLECLRAGGINVDEWMQEAESLGVQELARSTSSLSMRTDASGQGENQSSDSFYDSDNADPDSIPAASTSANIVDDEVISKSESADDSDVDVEVERQKIEELTVGWEDPTQVDWGGTEAETAAAAAAAAAGPIFKCTALYSYTAQNPDELTIVENEQLEVVGEGDGDGWLRARNYRGEEGYVPHNYLDVERDNAVDVNATSQLQSQISFSSVDYTVDNEDMDGYQDSVQSPDQVSVISAPVKVKSSVQYCVAMYDYDATAEDELTFEEGQIIKIVNKEAHGVDDGWWEGELEGKHGNFPSLVVEDCDENGEPLTDDDNESPISAEPPFSLPPPPVPQEFAVESDVEALQNGLKHITDKFELDLTPAGQQKQFKVPPPVCSVMIMEPEESPSDGDKSTKDPSSPDFGLGVAQITITAATPMAEDHAKEFDPPDDIKEESEEELREIQEEDEEEEDESEEEIKKSTQIKKDNKPKEQEKKSSPPDNGPIKMVESPPKSQENYDDLNSNKQEPIPEVDNKFEAYFEANFDDAFGEALGEVKAIDETNAFDDANFDDAFGEEDPPKMVVGGRASIPDELAPHQLARLQNLKESNA